MIFRYKEEGGPSKDEIPTAESLSMVIKRLMPYWEGTIVPAIKAGKKVLIVAHGSSLRSLVKHLEGLTDAQVFFACFYSFFGELIVRVFFSQFQIVETNVPTGIPFVYELDENFKATKERKV